MGCSTTERTQSVDIRLMRGRKEKEANRGCWFQRVCAVNGKVAFANLEVIRDSPGWTGSSYGHRHVLVFLRVRNYH